MDLKTNCNALRAEILSLEKSVLALKSQALTTNAPPAPGAPSPDPAEMTANVMLAYRHLEDARMRLGKAIQAYDGGVSVYDRKEAV